MKKLVGLLVAWVAMAGASVWGFDHQHSQFAEVLSRHVAWNSAGTATSVDYRALRDAPGDLQAYLQTLSAVERATFDNWSRDQQLAFLINAYNAFTLQLIIDHYPVASIKDIGRFWQNPWKRRFFQLLGKERHLDAVEHEIIREPGVYDEPRIHFAVNCAAIGCPALRDEPFTAGQLETQLEDSTRRFLSDSRRNRYRDGTLQVSPIFDWYREDFQRGWRGIHTRHDFLARYADSLSLPADAAQALSQGELPIAFTDYDWGLNDTR